jgi:outer membrane protein
MYWKKSIIITFLGLSSLYGKTLQGEISLGIFNHAPSGNAAYTLPGETMNAAVDLKNTFGWEQENNVMFKAYLEHSLPFLPHMKIGYTNLSHAGQNNTTDFFWGNIISFDGFVASSLDLKLYDITPYYEILDNGIEADLGVTLRYINGDIAVNTLLQNETTDFESLVPMLYGKAKITIPGTAISVQCEANAISTDETAFYDYKISARYAFGLGLSLEGGYKAFHLDSDELADGLKTNIDFRGPYTMLAWSF